MSLVVVLADSLRHDAAGCCGGEARTAVLDGLSSEGVLFDRVISSAPWTVPSVAAMMTGVYAHRLGLAKWEQPWPARHPSLFTLARRAGWEVGSFVFDPVHLFRRVPEAAVVGTSQDVEPMFDWIGSRRGKRFLAFVHYWWTHVPYIDRRMSVRAWRTATDRVLEAMRSGAAARAGARRLYLRGVERFSDRFLARLLDAVDLDETCLAVCSDHGEGFEERPETAALTDVFDLHGNTLHDEVLRVPLLIRPPGGTAPRRVGDLVRTVDIAPTLAEICGFDDWPERAGSLLDGVSLAPCVRDGAPIPALEAVSAQSRDFVDLPDLPRDPAALWNGFALTSRRFKQIWQPDGDRRVAFDLEADPGETSDVHAALADSLKGGWDRLAIERGRATVGALHAEDSARVRRRLEGLGYLD